MENIFKVRASSVGELMTPPKLKKDREANNLSATAKRVVEEWFLDMRVGKKPEDKNRYLWKGTIMEEKSIELLSKFLRMDLEKNTETRESDYYMGTPDIVLDDAIIDIKTSYSYRSFPLFRNPLNKNYFWQLVTYMLLFNKSRAFLAYVLPDAPEEIIEMEMEYRLLKLKALVPEDVKRISDEVYSSMVYDLPLEHRVRIFEIELEYELFEYHGMIIEKVIKARKYVEELIENSEYLMRNSKNILK